MPLLVRRRPDALIKLYYRDVNEEKEHSICHRNLPQIYQMVYLLSAQPKLASFSLFIFIKQQKRNILIVQMIKKKANLS